MKFFYGWKIAILCMLGNVLLQGAAIYSMNAFMEPLCEQNGWTRAALNMSLGLAAFFGQISMPIAAAIATQYNLRMLMAIGALVGGLATCAMGFTGNLAWFTLFLIVLWIASQFCGGVVANALISNWFSHYRGVAFGIANSGTSLSGMVLPFCSMIMIQYCGLSATYLMLGIFAALLAAPSIWLVRRTPQMLHMHPDGAAVDPPPGKGVQKNTTLRRLIRTPAAWCIGLAFGLTLMVGAGVLSQLKPRFSDLGMESRLAMILAGVSAFCGTASKYGWGYLCDKLSPIVTARIMTASCFLSMLLIFLPPTFMVLVAFATIFATCLGGAWVVLPAVTAWYFGSENFLGVYKLITVFLLVRCLGFPIMGLSYDVGNNYVLADVIFSMCLLLSFVLTLFVRANQAAENGLVR